MSNTHSVCSLHPYFKVKEGSLGEFKKLCQEMIAHTRTEEGCLYYGFSFNEDIAFCREAYVDAAALLVHVESVSSLVGKALELAELIRLEVHGPASELQHLKEPLAELEPEYFEVEFDYCR